MSGPTVPPPTSPCPDGHTPLEMTDGQGNVIMIVCTVCGRSLPKDTE